MFIPYCTYLNNIEVVYSEWKNNCTLVHFEQPDAKYGFKTLDITIPHYQVFNIVGFDEDKIAELITFCKYNETIIVEGAKKIKAKNK